MCARMYADACIQYSLQRICCLWHMQACLESDKVQTNCVVTHLMIIVDSKCRFSYCCMALELLLKLSARDCAFMRL